MIFEKNNKSPSVLLNPTQISGVTFSGYRRLWRLSIFLTSLVALTPLAVMTVFSYTQDLSAYKAERNFTISLILSTTKKSLEFIIEERRSAIDLVTRETSLNKLRNDDALRLILKNLKESFGGFVDLSLLDEKGFQTNYVGPFDLEGREYSDQSWFHEVSMRGSAVSDVFMGYRNFPHFVIAIKLDRHSEESFVLRATIDMELLYQQIYSLDLDKSMDAFIVNKNGILQTASVFYGDAFGKVDLDFSAHLRAREVIEEFNHGAGWTTVGYSYIEDTPFILVTTMRHQNPLSYWLARRSMLLWFLVGSVIIIFIFVFRRATYMVNRLRESDLKRAKALHNIEYTNKMVTIGRMAASVAHEINNPLAIINEKTGLLKDMVNYNSDFPKKEKTISLLDAVLNSVDRCSKVTHRLLGFTRRMDIRKELIDISRLMKEVVSFIGKEAEHRNIEITYDFPDNMHDVESDRGQLQQIFLNIINNATAAVEDGGRIEISTTHSDENSVDVCISDNGSGIAPDELKHIFEPFYSTKGEFGTGLGLSITHDIVTKLGGKINVESEFGKGTQFIVTLPVRKDSYLE